MNREEFFKACEEGDIQAIQKWVDDGRDINVKEFLEQTICQHLAAEYGHTDALKYLVETGKVDLNAKDWGSAKERALWDADPNVEHEGMSLLHCMIAKNDIQGIRLLSGREGVNYEIYFRDLTPLMLACATGKTEAAEALIDGGAALEAMTRHGGRTALYLSVENNKLATASLLLQRGASILPALLSNTILGDEEETQEIRDLITARVLHSDPARVLGSEGLGHAAREMRRRHMGAQRGYVERCNLL